jgi:DnaD/phage-associated family protein
MKTFSGFPSGKVRAITLPESVFTQLVPLIDDVDELKITLYVLYRLSEQRGRVRYLRRRELEQDDALQAMLGDEPEDAFRTALARAVERGTLLRAEARIQGRPEIVYFANSPRGRAAFEALRRGEGLPESGPAPRPNIFVLYEENIGVLTPLIAEELKEAEQLYPDEWIETAFREAVDLNKRSWRYIRAILERWRTEGRMDEESRRDREEDRRRYVEGKYGDFIER